MSFILTFTYYFALRSVLTISSLYQPLTTPSHPQFSIPITHLHFLYKSLTFFHYFRRPLTSLWPVATYFESNHRLIPSSLSKIFTFILICLNFQRLSEYKSVSRSYCRCWCTHDDVQGRCFDCPAQCRDDLTLEYFCGIVAFRCMIFSLKFKIFPFSVS